MGVMWRRLACPVCKKTWVGEFFYTVGESAAPPEQIMCSECEKYLNRELEAVANKIKDSGIFEDVEEWITKIPQEYWNKKADLIESFSEIINAEFRKVDLKPFGVKPEASVIYSVRVKTQKGIVPAYLSASYVFKGKVSGLMAIGNGFKFTGVKMFLI